MAYLPKGNKFNFHAQYWEYDSQTNSTQNSGAYIFVPVGPAIPLPAPSISHIITGWYVTLCVFGGVFTVSYRLVQEVYQEFTGYISHVVRLYSSSGDIDVEGFVEVNATIGNPHLFCTLFSLLTISQVFYPQIKKRS